MKSRNMAGMLGSLALALSVSDPVQALDVSHKDELLKLTQEAIAQAKLGESGAMVANAKEAQRLAYTSLKARHSFIMQSANDRLQQAIWEGEKGQMEPAIELLEEVVADVTAEGRDTMTP